jgi:hypothetical protein
VRSGHVRGGAYVFEIAWLLLEVRNLLVRIWILGLGNRLLGCLIEEILKHCDVITEFV